MSQKPNKPGSKSAIARKVGLLHLRSAHGCQVEPVLEGALRKTDAMSVLGKGKRTPSVSVCGKVGGFNKHGTPSSTALLMSSRDHSDRFFSTRDSA